MTWQRIDEDTYIDDTLVTCAEYQLFIDEMLEQGKYYQPDHWVSCNFLSGRAREPIMGVRYADAVTFCEWLTNKFGGEWKFFLPTEGDVKKFSVESNKLSILAYWGNRKSQLIWVGSPPQNARALSFDMAFQFGETIKDKINLLYQSMKSQPFDLDLYLTSNGNDQSGDQAFQPLIHRRKIEDYLTKQRLGIYNDLDRFEIYKQYIKTAASNEADTNGSIRGVINGIGYLASVENLRRENMTKEINELITKLIDLTTLQERIAGRSPAFEGIRLVKERIK